MTPPPIPLFIAACLPDHKYVDIFSVHLAALENAGLLLTWHAGQLAAGEDIAAVTQRKLAAAQLIVLLISADLLADTELWQSALERERSGQCQLIPILIRPTSLRATPLSGRLLLPRSGRPVSQYSDDEPWRDIVELVHKKVNELHGVNEDPLDSSQENTPHPLVYYAKRKKHMILTGCAIFILVGFWIKNFTGNEFSETRTVSWQIDSHPQRAAVLQVTDGKYLCNTPCKLALPRRIDKLEVKIDLSSYWSKKVVLDLSHDGAISEALDLITDNAIPPP